MTFCATTSARRRRGSRDEHPNPPRAASDGGVSTVSPRANFVCNAKRCATDEGAPIYELPVGSTRCPVCGSKRLKRVWAGPENAPSINKGIAKFVDSAAEPAYEQATRIIDRGKEVERQAQKAGVPSFAVPVGQVGAALARLEI